MAKSHYSHHPEEMDGEVFVGNYQDESHHKIQGQGIFLELFDKINWKTKRQGKIAYDINGKVIENVFPVFVQRSEMREAGFDPDSMWLRI